MGATLASVHALLSRPENVRLQVLGHLFMARVHNAVKFSYETFLVTSPSSSWVKTRPTSARTLHAYSASHHDHWRAPAARDLDSPAETHGQRLTQGLKHRRPGSSRRGGRNLMAAEHTPEPQESHTNAATTTVWDWRHFPVQARALVWYDWVSTCWLGWACIRTLLQAQLDALVDPLSRWLLDLPGNCLLMGRLAKPPTVSQLITPLLCSYHLAWRLVQWRTRRNRLITMVVFLMASERDLERFYTWLELEWRQGAARQTRALQPGRPMNTSLSAKKSLPTAQLFAQVMCYEVARRECQRVVLRLRPNRTLEARRLLARRTAHTTLLALAFFLLELLVMATLINLWLLSDFRYALTYPGCQPQLDARLARGELSYFSSVTLREHHLLSFPVDSFENLVIWLDSGLSLTFVPVFAYLLNYDLLLYWAAIDTKLQALVKRAAQQHNHLLHHLYELMGEKEEEEESERRLETDIRELQCEMADFFNQVRRADMIVGDTLSLALLIWLVGCAFINLNLLVYTSTSDLSLISTVVEGITILGFFVLSTATYTLLGLRRAVLRSYQSFCSLMALDQSRSKRTFVKLMDFHQNNSATYRLFRAYAYKPTTFITVLGWSFSCFFIIFTLFAKPPPHAAVDGEHQ